MSGSRVGASGVLRLGALLAALALSGCLRPSEPWVSADEAVGRASAEGVTLEVAEGLAAVHRLSAEGATLWLTAPAVRLHLRGLPTDRPFTLRLRNTLADAVPLGLDGPDGPLPAAPLAVAVDRPRPTEAVFVLPPGPAERHLAWAPPESEVVGSWRFGVLSDVQERLSDVQDIFEVIAADPGVRFVVSAGDLTERGGADELTDFQAALAHLPVPMYATPGNHERGVDAGPYQRLFGRGSYRFWFRGVQFLMVDSGAATIDPTVYGWLEGWLAAGRDAVQVFVSHVPPFDPIGARSGSFRSRREAAKLVALLGRHGVDVALHGHVHSYYAYSAGGVPTYISGGGGSIPERLDGVERHFLTVDVEPNRLRGVSLVRVE